VVIRCADLATPSTKQNLALTSENTLKWATVASLLDLSSLLHIIVPLKSSVYNFCNSKSVITYQPSADRLNAAKGTCLSWHLTESKWINFNLITKCLGLKLRQCLYYEPKSRLFVIFVKIFHLELQEVNRGKALDSPFWKLSIFGIALACLFLSTHSDNYEATRVTIINIVYVDIT
jgi:hypothetical protein